MAHIRYLDDAGQLRLKNLDSDHFLIGRGPHCQITLDDETISREHLRIDMGADGRYRVRDLGSRNKTYVNGELIAETLLIGGDIVRVGDRVVEFVDDAPLQERLDLDFIVPDRTEPPDCEWLKIKQPVSLTLPQVEQLSLLWSDPAMMARPEDIANMALGQIILDLQGERGLIALRGEEKTDLRPLAYRALRKPVGGAIKPVSQSFILAPLLQSVAGRYPRSTTKITGEDYAATAVVAPLTFKGDVVGVLYVDRPASKKPFPPTALQYGLAAAAQIGAMLGEASRKLVRSAAREGVAWMTTLRRIQTAFTSPVTSTDSFAVALKCHAGRVRCGDLGDLVHLDEQRCAVLLIDAGGHGITGVVQANAIRSAVRTTLRVAEDALIEPGALFNELNTTVASSPTRQVLPCTYVGIDLAAGKLAYINAGGMPPMLMMAPGRLVTLDQSSLVLGVQEDYLYDATSVDLPETFRVVCHTNGLTEATNASGDSLGHDWLHEVLLDREAFAGVTEILSRIGQAWTRHLAGAQPDDDALVLALSHG